MLQKLQPNIDSQLTDPLLSMDCDDNVHEMETEAAAGSGSHFLLPLPLLIAPDASNCIPFSLSLSLWLQLKPEQTTKMWKCKKKETKKSVASDLKKHCQQWMNLSGFWIPWEIYTMNVPWIVAWELRL